MNPDVDRRVRMAARALGRQGLAHAYGHCSERLDSQTFRVCAPKPMGCITADDAGTTVPIHGPLPDGVLGEVRVHQQIYARRPEVGAIIRCMPPLLMALSTARVLPAPRHGPGTYFQGRMALWDDPQLIRDDERAAQVAQTLGAGAAVVMRGNGVVVVGPTLRHALVWCWYLEDAAQLEWRVRSAGLANESVQLSADECAQRATEAGGIVERMADYLTHGDPEGDWPLG